MLNINNELWDKQNDDNQSSILWLIYKMVISLIATVQNNEEKLSLRGNFHIVNHDLWVIDLATYYSTAAHRLGMGVFFLSLSILQNLLKLKGRRMRKVAASRWKKKKNLALKKRKSSTAAVAVGSLMLFFWWAFSLLGIFFFFIIPTGTHGELLNHPFSLFHCQRSSL